MTDESDSVSSAGNGGKSAGLPSAWTPWGNRSARRGRCRHPDRGYGAGRAVAGGGNSGTIDTLPSLGETGTRRQNLKLVVGSDKRHGNRLETLRSPWRPTAVLASISLDDRQALFHHGHAILVGDRVGAKLTSNASPRGMSHSPKTS